MFTKLEILCDGSSIGFPEYCIKNIWIYLWIHFKSPTEQYKCDSLCSPLDNSQYFTLLSLISELRKIFVICSFYSCMRLVTFLYILKIIFYVKIINKSLKNHKNIHILTMYIISHELFTFYSVWNLFLFEIKWKQNMKLKNIFFWNSHL